MVVEPVLEEVDDVFVGDLDYSRTLVEKGAHVLASVSPSSYLAISKSMRVLERPMVPAKLLVNWSFSWSHWSIEFLSSDSSQVGGAWYKHKGK
jgi:hypothetical protein